MLNEEHQQLGEAVVEGAAGGKYADAEVSMMAALGGNAAADLWLL